MTALLFVHGAGCTPAVFDAQLAAFEESAAPALPPDGTTIAHLASWLGERIQRDAIVAGSSMGGAIALELALQRHARVRGIVLIGSGTRLRVAPALLAALRDDFPAAARTVAGYFYAEPSRRQLDAAAAMIEAAGQARTLRDFEACNAFDVTDRVSELALPLLAVTGERDVMTPPKYAAALADRVPGAQVRIIPGAGHLVMAERPDETNAAIRNFVEQVA